MTPSPAPPDQPAGTQDIRLDTARLRVLAHPLRLNVLALLRQRGPSTATRIAAELGINPGSASYHLRRLAAGGLIVETPGRGTGRERWWESVHRQSIHDPADEPEHERAAGRAYAHAVALAAVERLRKAADEVPLLPAEWYEASVYSDFTMRLAPQDVERMRAEIFEVISAYRQGEAGAPQGAVPVSLQVQAFPVPGTVDLDVGDA
ncbi:ArsR/SmtB family transcription factor [Streptomyces sp. NBC_01104]|uniref:ArsR/SmtB family transcription factor n=1 Tax=Streptomyces sp. NBC_01104 TaxID=2903750 RepID=UPI003869ADC4|nr:helix-turn-helix domain-containing protein [Streptomyces sp. NBC_01104]